MKLNITAWIRSKIHIPSSLQRMQWAILTIFVYLLNACVPSGKPSSEELIKTRMPTFLGATTASFTTGSPPFVLNGECDPISYGIEWSYNQITWNTYAPSCPTGTFSINVITNGVKKVYVRSKTKLGQTPSAVATIRLVLPPTSPAFQVVSSGNGANEGDGNTTFTMGVMDGVPTSTVTEKLDTNITGIVYGP